MRKKGGAHKGAEKEEPVRKENNQVNMFFLKPSKEGVSRKKG